MTTPAYVLALALSAQPEFWEQVQAIRDQNETATTIAPRYFARYLPQRHRRRVELIERYLEAAADADERMAKARICNLAPVGYAVDGVLGPTSPQRGLRSDVRETLMIGALRVARRGAGRCVAHDCGYRDCHKHGCWDRDCAIHRPGAPGVAGDYCSPCEAKSRRPREAEEAERTLFDGAIAAVLGGESRPARRRAA